MSSVEKPSLSPGFPTTQWSVVLDAAHADSALASAALEKLCRRYWYPVYAFVRQRGHPVHAAEDLTQGFFAALLARRAFDRVEASKGRFRSFLLASLNHHLLNEHDRAQTRKRGGGCHVISLEELGAEEQYRLETADHESPEHQFDRRWATVLVQRVLERLREEWAQRGNATLFHGLQPWLTSEPEPGAHERLGAQLSMEPGTLSVALHRLRRRFGALLRAEVAHTVSTPEDVEAELRHLLAVIGG
jgi:RNA polymerase sigma-70 factor (ECF subfamily)